MAKSRMNTYCPYCASIVPAGKTCKCRDRTAERSRTEPWRSRYRSPDYERNRQAAIERQRGRCKDCGKVCARHDGKRWVTRELGGEVDHEVPLREGGTDDTRNLALRCRSCHRLADSRRRKKKN